MTVVYAKLDIELHGLKIETHEQLEKMLTSVRDAVRAARVEFYDASRGELEGDVELSMDLTAGNMVARKS